MLNSQGFDLWADGYDRSVGLSDDDGSYPFAGYKKVLNALYNEILSVPKAEVLDIGFGTGTLTTMLYKQGCSIWGQDFSSRMIELAQEKMPGAHFVQGDFTEGLAQSLRAQKYDYIVATYSLHHLTDAEKIPFIRSLLPLLKPGGKLLIGDVAFRTRAELEACKKISGDEWDGDEYYFVYDELLPAFSGKPEFQKMSHCAGILTIGTET